MTDPYVTFEQADPETGTIISTGLTQQSIIEALIAEGQSFRIIKIVNPEPPEPPQDTQG